MTFVKRTIRRDGTVKINGNVYRTREPLLDRHYGMRPLFAMYRGTDEKVALWGEEDHAAEGKWPGAFCDGGVFKWEWWEKVA